MTDRPTTEPRPHFDRRALTDDQRMLAEDIATSMPDRHDESCGVWSEDGDGCDCPLVMAIADGLHASRVVAIEVERGWDSATHRGERVVRLPFSPMPAEAAQGAAPRAEGPAEIPETMEAMPTHDNGCRCWPHVSRRDAERMIERVALAEYRSGAAPRAEGLDVERLRLAMERAINNTDDLEAIAAEYARLTESSERPEGDTK